MSKSEVLVPQASNVENIAAAVAGAWDRARPDILKKIDILDDAAMALLDNSLPPDLKKNAHAESQSVAELAAKFGFQRGSGIARDIAEKFSSDSITRVDGVAISEPLLALRTALEGAPQA